MSEIILTDASFEQEVLQAKEPVLVDFWAPWCGPCRIQGPIVEELARELSGKAKVAKLNVDENQGTAEKYGVMSIPTIIIFKNGQIVEQLIGVQNKETLADKLASHNT
ncbi:thioredoxin [Candidatus Falkowbacteria bacterium CG10_big_fil_rev_8_21_14_0_10_44_15]|uniref:Thioredoxin n=1 Tax=Candidatus Falkowbacteria bacterium CG10_big_fil_rev_8_21_14_0_10_44_15 TaxID=1974569 RepID=A0A2H0V0D8_9BACT|nr:MAG: thioredoxin [Candidatus Falkowbacteria bacterium CG10_big_fil_rev_8_21_14_0_10_44_15]